MDHKTIMILGGSTMQLPALRAARDCGWTVVLADGNANCEGRTLCDHFHHVDLVDIAGLVNVAEQYPLDGVFTAGTDFSLSVAQVAARRGLPGIAPEVANKATDKFLMRRAFAASGVPSPDFVEVAEGDGPERAKGVLELPLVVKPVDNMGARGVRRVDSLSELAKAVDDARSTSRSRRVIMESYMPGPELSLDAVVADGVITICGVADRHITFPPYFVEMGHTMPSGLENHVLDKVIRVFEDGIRALGIDNGTAKGDIKVTAGRPMVGEIAARLSGGYMSGWTYPYATGVPLTTAAMRLAVGLSPGDLTPRWEKVSAERAFISIPGRVRAIEGLDLARRVADVKEIFQRVLPGDRVVFPRSNVEKCGNVITQSSTRSGAVAAAAAALETILVRLEPCEDDTEDFLFGSAPGTTAYHLTDPDNRQALQTMATVARNPGDRGEVSITQLPKVEAEEGHDWHGVPFERALLRVCQLTGARVGGSTGVILGRRFWEAFLRGSVQGGVYVIDTARRGSE